MPDDDPTDAPETEPENPTDPEPGDDLDPAALRAALAAARKDAAKYRTRAKELEPLAAKAKELEDASKSETDKLTERATAAETRAASAEAALLRLEVAADKGLTPAQAKRLVGDTREELEADADELLATFSPQEGTPGDPRPKPKLRPGAAPEAEPDELDPRKLAAQIRR